MIRAQNGPVEKDLGPLLCGEIRTRVGGRNTG